MTVQKQQRQNEVILRIRKLKNKKDQRGGLDSFDWAELVELQVEANENNWIYW